MNDLMWHEADLELKLSLALASHVRLCLKEQREIPATCSGLSFPPCRAKRTECHTLTRHMPQPEPGKPTHYVRPASVLTTHIWRSGHTMRTPGVKSLYQSGGEHLQQIVCRP